jgi:hypothetical protein
MLAAVQLIPADTPVSVSLAAGAEAVKPGPEALLVYQTVADAEEAHSSAVIAIAAQIRTLDIFLVTVVSPQPASRCESVNGEHR